MSKAQVRIGLTIVATLLASAAPAQQRRAAPTGGELALNASGYYEAPGADVLVFSNWYDGLFADSKISGVEIIQQDERIATNGDVRLSATPGQWDATARFVGREVDQRSGAITVTLEYPDQHWRYRVRSERAGGAVKISVLLDEPVPAALAGRAGFNLEFLPAAYFHHGYLADERTGTFPLYPADAMTRTPERNAASGRAEGPGAEPQPIAAARRFVLAPEDAARRVTIESSEPVQLYDGRNQAQNGWFVLRSMLPTGRTGAALEWTIRPTSVPGWRRAPVIAHSQLGYTPGGRKVATIELDRADTRALAPRLLRVGADGAMTPVTIPAAERWGHYLRYAYLRLDFTAVRQPGLYVLEYGGTRTAPFRIADDVYAGAWHPTLDVYFPVAMDHMYVNEGYRVWHGEAHRDDARQAPVDHEHIDLYAQGPTTDTPYKPGEHIPGLNTGGWFDAGDFDIRTQSQYQVIRSMVDSWERWRPTRDTTAVDETRRRTELHVPDGTPDLLQQIAHGTRQLVAQFDAVGHAIHGIVEPDVAQYTHLGDASTKTDGLIYDPSLPLGEEKDGRSGMPDDRWAFTTKTSALNYGAIAGLAAASRALQTSDPMLAKRALALATSTWAEEQSHAPDLYQHGNTTGGPLAMERFSAAVELLRATRDPRYVTAVQTLYPEIESRFAPSLRDAVAAIPFMPASYRARMIPAVRAYATESDKAATANPFGVPITTGGWAGSGTVMGYALNAYALHKAFPEIVPADAVFRGAEFLLGHHPGSDRSFVSGVGTLSKEVAYGNNRADFSFIAGGVVPGVLVIKPDFPENHEDWPFFWGENEYVIPEGAMWIELAQAVDELARERR
ncbi:glycoside hydrolase family 9 protein [Sphingomonas sp. RHCKR7]|uniref:glycoside hydrolase family 9 protein n=1 Tax=Sphingomonas folli TaxID=2862497 RepID=UPI001CA595EE|nr:glycoside hydrolase family 9 protein [Sphingomonas folli]MBW6526714.1 glycoside hydrolase family 9 protein [Sphingomonas folli]